jgi:hypothetical protein
MARNYDKVEPYFHNFEHNEAGTTHCHSEGNYPYEIKMVNGKHIITGHIARGHGYGNEPQWFVFINKLGSGYDLSSGIKIDNPEQASSIIRLVRRKGLKAVQKERNQDDKES